MKVFLDTSALAKRYVQEPGSEELENLFSKGATEVFVSTLALPEFGAALGRKVREKEITKESAGYALMELETDWRDLFVKIPPTDDVASSAVSLALQHPLKGTDAVHLASAMIAGVVLFVTSDKQLLSTSQKVGLREYDPSEGPLRGQGQEKI